MSLLLAVKTMVLSSRMYRNFGHKREPVPLVTVLWQGFLTMTFIGLCIEWKKIGNFIFGVTKEEKVVAETFIKKSGTS